MKVLFKKKKKMQTLNEMTISYYSDLDNLLQSSTFVFMLQLLRTVLLDLCGLFCFCFVFLVKHIKITA